MRVGVVKAEITPPIGFPLSGYRARSGVSKGVHDRLYSRAIAIESAAEKVILISVDVLGLSSSFVSELRKHISKATSVPCTNIMIAATHTHSGPHTIQTFFNANAPLDADYMSFLATAITQSGIEAWKMRIDARVGVGSCQVNAIGMNRRDPGQGAVDRQAAIVRVDRQDGSLMAVAVLYGCHPTVLGVGNLLITGDYPAATIETLEKAGADVFALFFNGAEGNVSIGRSSEMSAIGVQTRDRTFKRAWELGERLARAVLQILPEIQTSASTVIRVAHREESFAGRKFPPTNNLKSAVIHAHELSQRVRLDTQGATRAKILVEEVYAEARYNNACMLEKLNNIVPIEITGVRIGHLIFIGVPAEVFTETGLTIKASIYEHMFILGMANGYIGYLPTRKAYNDGGYEVEVALCDVDSERRLLRAMEQLAALLLPESATSSEGER